MLPILLLLLAYLIGSIPFALIVSRAMGLADPRSFGSGNPGATNVLRSGNKTAAALTLLGDAAKGWLVVWLVRHHGADWGLDVWTQAGAAVAVFLGHVFSFFLRGKGGKGVATAAGVLFGLSPALGGLVLAVWLATAIITRYSSLAAILAAVSAPALTHWQMGAEHWTTAVAAMVAVLIWRHQANIQRLLRGEESRIGRKKKT
ncbi:MAG: glycerol-3-phosphate acyltransferase [Candidatus Dactylopiibacterium carminicum]|uniref:Glycerol-3-phosphate acyltransferase n=1 Tax=Candidatus Dactylopiibacterium carminicum TaxID=857335 RepID=A0A272EX48_9RHOO|nr:glycerol-3-phosphate 1-O-acyltransferase PlsY [Candidatus Dactylopiibacterium carminicum]KAF7600251.1 glycerol-3-phosphate 1-O-acyltransferase PlsY [Candidatus Dactylopiibacterium carminicum]PAS94697.1 MAG: glycerol-3-phosphate acyltransferase [Candidatus Dactylopiibacterium carminicum]PAS96984.1 MAG: glycerol-3-phosphate acyltransferase [Candidatus Dactylopiibacterium carminicum]PAT00250.1 MAG: glycerol-3-phosphate acyltransferase [Candidatus Dactylopiibacterium carminicum]